MSEYLQRLHSLRKTIKSDFYETCDATVAMKNLLDLVDLMCEEQTLKEERDAGGSNITHLPPRRG